MSTLVQNLYSHSEYGVETELEAAGTWLENPYAYDSAARELQSMAERGWITILRQEHHDQALPLIKRIVFSRLR